METAKSGSSPWLSTVLLALGLSMCRFYILYVCRKLYMIGNMVIRRKRFNKWKYAWLREETKLSCLFHWWYVGGQQLYFVSSVNILGSTVDIWETTVVLLCHQLICWGQQLIFGVNSWYVMVNSWYVGSSVDIWGQQLIFGRQQLICDGQQLVCGIISWYVRVQQFIFGRQQLVCGDQQLVLRSQQLIFGDQQSIF